MMNIYENLILLFIIATITFPLLVRLFNITFIEPFQKEEEPKEENSDDKIP